MQYFYCTDVQASALYSRPYVGIIQIRLSVGGYTSLSACNTSSRLLNCTFIIHHIWNDCKRFLKISCLSHILLDNCRKSGHNRYKCGAGINPTDVTLPLGSRAARCAGSIPVTRTNEKSPIFRGFLLFYLLVYALHTANVRCAKSC